MNARANEEGRVKVFIIKTEYGYAVSPSPVVVPSRGATLYFENLTNVTAKISIPDERPSLTLEVERHRESQLVKLPDETDRVISYSVEMGGELYARGHSAPIIIRDP